MLAGPSSPTSGSHVPPVSFIVSVYDSSERRSASSAPSSRAPESATVPGGTPTTNRPTTSG